VTDLRARIVAEARTWIDTPYVHQASLKGAGCDCLGLVRGVWREVMGSEPEAPPPYSRDWAERSGRETLRDAAERHLVRIEPTEARERDVLLFAFNRRAPAKHCAILTAPIESPDPRMIHAHDRLPADEVAVVPWWRRRARYAFSFPASGIFPGCSSPESDLGNIRDRCS
jgi:NlpC/P60 family putative phage cell wall peptidase